MSISHSTTQDPSCADFWFKCDYVHWISHGFSLFADANVETFSLFQTPPGNYFSAENRLYLRYKVFSGSPIPGSKYRYNDTFPNNRTFSSWSLKIPILTHFYVKFSHIWHLRFRNRKFNRSLIYKLSQQNRLHNQYLFPYLHIDGTAIFERFSLAKQLSLF